MVIHQALVIAHDAPARGASTADLIPASIVALIAVALVAFVSARHRSGRLKALARSAAVIERRTGRPAWADLPIALCIGSLVVAVFGYYWDVSWHIDRGRDPGPFANPAHWFIIVGLAGIALSGVLSVVLGDGRSSGASLRIRPGWYAPVGGVLLAVCGTIALAGFPLDDMWHRIFGQDVTAWGPTHIQMIGGASLATLTLLVLDTEATRLSGGGGRFQHVQRMLFGGAFLLGLSSLQVEFDYGVPQFRQLYHPVLLMLAAGIGLVSVRILAGRGAALVSAAFFDICRVGLMLLIGPVLGRSTLHFPLYLAEAAVVEAVAWAASTDDPVRFGALSGLGIGTVGLAAEWGWSHVFMPLPWPSALLPWGAVLGFAAACCGALLGALVGRSLTTGAVARRRVPRGLGPAAAAGALLCVAIPLPTTARVIPAQVTVVPLAGGHADVALRVPPGTTTHANWFNVTSWQGEKHGNGGLALTPLRRIGPGEYRAASPVPVTGTWKTMVRLQRGSELEAVPLFLPADPEIPAPSVPAVSGRRAFVADKKILQREAVGGSVGLQRAAYAVLLLLALVWMGSIGWGLSRMGAATWQQAARARTRWGARDPVTVR